MDLQVLNELKQDTEVHTLHYEQRKLRMMAQLSQPFRDKVNQAIHGFRQIIPSSFTDYQTISLLYQCIMSEAVYGKNTLCRSFVGALRDRTAVCAGFSELFVLLARELTSCEMYYVVGYTSPIDNVKEGDSRHAWNIVQFKDHSVLHGRSFHLDVTWDLGEKKPSFFLKSDKEMSDRFWIHECYPASEKPFRGHPYKNEQVLSELREYYRSLKRRFSEGVLRLY